MLLWQGEKECSYYIKTGQCKFGETCKFHHPQPSSTPVPAPAPEYYPTMPSPLVPSSPQFGGVAASWQVGRPPLLPGSFVQGTYGSVLVSGGMVPFSGWSPYQVRAQTLPAWSQNLCLKRSQ